MHTLLRHLFLAGGIFTLLASSHVAAQDTGQVTRPLSEPTLSTERLPAPQPAASQQRDGQIFVTWAPVEGAVSYRMWRSVPPAPQTTVTLPNPQNTGYADLDVKQGSTYYYLVAAVNAAGIEGLKGGTTPVTAAYVSPSLTTAPVVRASLWQQDPQRVYVSFSGSDAMYYEVERTTYSSPSADPSQIDYTRPATIRLPRVSSPSRELLDPLPASPYARSLTYTVRTVVMTGYMSPPGKASVIMPASTTSTTTGDSTTGGTSTGGTTGPTTGGTTGGTTSTTGTSSYSGTAATGSTTLTVAVPASLTTGATTSLGSAVGTSARWLSLNDTIATVDASGNVTARAAGTTQVIAFNTTADGSVRVVAIPVTVK